MVYVLGLQGIISIKADRNNSALLEETMTNVATLTVQKSIEVDGGIGITIALTVMAAIVIFSTRVAAAILCVPMTIQTETTEGAMDRTYLRITVIILTYAT